MQPLICEQCQENPAICLPLDGVYGRIRRFCSLECAAKQALEPALVEAIKPSKIEGIKACSDVKHCRV